MSKGLKENTFSTVTMNPKSEPGSGQQPPNYDQLSFQDNSNCTLLSKTFYTFRANNLVLQVAKRKTETFLINHSLKRNQ